MKSSLPTVPFRVELDVLAHHVVHPSLHLVRHLPLHVPPVNAKLSINLSLTNSPNKPPPNTIANKITAQSLYSIVSLVTLV